VTRFLGVQIFKMLENATTTVHNELQNSESRYNQGIGGRPWFLTELQGSVNESSMKAVGRLIMVRFFAYDFKFLDNYLIVS